LQFWPPRFPDCAILAPIISNEQFFGQNEEGQKMQKGANVKG
jgi:hypothetical protein